MTFERNAATLAGATEPADRHARLADAVQVPRACLRSPRRVLPPRPRPDRMAGDVLAPQLRTPQVGVVASGSWNELRLHGTA